MCESVGNFMNHKSTSVSNTIKTALPCTPPTTLSLQMNQFRVQSMLLFVGHSYLVLTILLIYSIAYDGMSNNCVQFYPCINCSHWQDNYLVSACARWRVQNFLSLACWNIFFARHIHACLWAHTHARIHKRALIQLVCFPLVCAYPRLCQPYQSCSYFALEIHCAHSGSALKY